MRSHDERAATLKNWYVYIGSLPLSGEAEIAIMRLLYEVETSHKELAQTHATSVEVGYMGQRGC